MKKDIVIVAASAEPPYVYPCFVNYTKILNDQPLCKEPGVEIALLHDQLHALGFEPVFIDAHNATNMKYLLKNNMADIAGTTEPPYALENLPFTFPICEDKLIFIVAIPDSVSIPSLLFYHCDWRLWFIFAMGLIVVLLYKKWHNYVLTGRFRTMTSHLSSKFPLIGWGLSFGIFTSVYSNNLAITMAQHKTDMPFNNLEQLANKMRNEKCKFILSQSQSFYSYTDWTSLKFSYNRKHINDISNAFKKAVILEAFNTTDFLAKIAEGECNVGIAWESVGALWETMNDKITFISVPEMMSLSFVYYMSPNFRQKYANRIVYINSGSIDSLYKSYLERMLKENRRKVGGKMSNVTSCSGRVHHHSLQMYQFKETFLILIAGAGFSSIFYAITLIKENVEGHLATRKLLSRFKFERYRKIDKCPMNVV